MKLNTVIDKLYDFGNTHDYEEDFDEFDALCDKLMSDNQTYFQWEVDGDCFSIEDAFDTVMSSLRDAQKEGKVIKDYSIDSIFGDDRVFLFVEYEQTKGV